MITNESTVSLNQLTQMSSYGMSCNYEADYRFALLVSTQIAIPISITVGVSSHFYFYYEDDLSLLSIIDYYGSTFLLTVLPIYVTLFIALTHCLFVRFALMNSLLRFVSLIRGQFTLNKSFI